jgi:hypothetical protein
LETPLKQSTKVQLEPSESEQTPKEDNILTSPIDETLDAYLEEENKVDPVLDQIDPVVEESSI